MIWQSAGHNNWVSISNTKEQLHVRFNQKANTLYTDFSEATDYTSQLLYQTFNNRPLFLALSGGMDSELVADAFVRNNIPFTPVILEIEDINKTELWYAYRWCKQHQIKPHIISITLKELEKIYLKYYKEMTVTHMTGVLTDLYTADYVSELGGYLITGAGDISYLFEKDQQFYVDLVDYSLPVYRPNQHPGGFFMYCPEIVLSYIFQFDTTKDERTNKINFYNMVPRPKIDWLEPVLSNPKSKIGAGFMVRSKFVPDSELHCFGNKSELMQLLWDK